MPGTSINGKITVEGLTPSSDLAMLRLMLQPSSGGVVTSVSGLPKTTSVAADGTFHIDRITPGEYRYGMVPLPVNYYVKEIRYGGADALNRPMIVASGSTDTLDVVLSPRVAQIDGSIIDDKQQPVQGLQAVLVPDQHRDRYELFRAVTTDQNGHFSIRGLPPGDYRIFAWETMEPYEYYDPDLLKRDEQRGLPLKIGESDQKTVSVRMIPAGTQ
jgi:hypothetical protein